MLTIIRFLAAAIAAIVLTAGVAGAAESSIQIRVPKRSGASQFEISALKLTLQLDNSNPISLSIAGPHGTRVTGLMTLTNAATDCFAGLCFVDFDAAPAPAVGADALVIIKPMHVGADPASAGNDKLVLLLQLISNINENTALCSSTMPPGDETWTITVTSAPTARIAGVALQSLDRKATGTCPTTLFRPIPLDDGPVATITSPAPEFASGRIGLDTVLVLDRSGSMFSTDGGTTSRLDKLKAATNQFLAMWNTLRTTESTNLIQSPTDHVGIVFFDHGTLWTTGVVANRLVEFNAAALPGLTAGVNGVILGGATSIGDGLIEATTPAGLPNAGGPNRRVVLLMTDGAQNTPQFAFASGNQVITADDSASMNPVALPKQPFQLYSVTVGNEFGPDAPINQQLAVATGGYTLNTSRPAAELDAFFLQTLQNYHKFSTVETMRIIQDTTRFGAPFETTVPVTSTTTRLMVSLTWAPGRDRLRVVLVPPGGGTPVPFAATGPVSSATTGGIRLPQPGSAGNWTLRVLTDGDNQVPIPFNLVLMGDDTTINTSLGVVAAEHVVGGRIKLTAQVNDFNKTLKGLNQQPGAVIKAITVTPGNSVGDVLSNSAAQPLPPPQGEAKTSMSPAQGKFAAMLSQNPAALIRIPGETILRDDGLAASGDTEAGDGNYSALVPAEFEGHYNFVFVVEGNSESGGRFVRQQIRTAHVRSLPDAGTTGLSTSTIVVDNGSILVVTLTPRNIKGQLMGGAWGNYFWFQPAGGTPVKGVDDLKGTYTARIPFTGATPPRVSVHFLPEPVVRSDLFVPQPGQLTPGNQLFPDVTQPGGAGKMGVWFALGTTFPRSDFAVTNEGGVAFNVGMDWSLTPATSIEGTFGWHRFGGKGADPDIDVAQFAIGGKWYFKPAPLRPYVTAGIGAYMFDPGSTHFGAHGGFGVQGDIRPHWSLDGRATLIGTTNNAPGSPYWTLQLGLRYEF